MSIKINETSPLNSILSGLSAIGEEAAAKLSPCCNSEDTIASSAPQEDCIETVFSTIFGTVSMVLDVIWESISNFVSYICDTIVCICGGTPNNNNISAEALEATRYYKLNRVRLSEVPRSIDLEKLPLNVFKLSEEEVEALYDNLLVEFDRVYPKIVPAANLPAAWANKFVEPYRDEETNKLSYRLTSKGQAWEARQPANPQVDLARELTSAHEENLKRAEMRESIEDLISHVKLRKGSADRFPYGANNSQLYQNKGIFAFLLNISERLKTTENLTKKSAVLNGLADAKGCDPQRFKSVKNEWGKLSGTAVDLKDLYLVATKFAKQEICLKRFQGSQFHAINEAMRKVADWGLDPDVAELNDPYARGGLISPLNVRYALNQDFTPACALSAFKNSLDWLDNQLPVNEFLERHADQLPEDWVESFYETFNDPDTGKNQRRLNYRGSAWIVGQLGYFSSALPIL